MKNIQQRRIGAFVIDVFIVSVLVSVTENLFVFLNESKSADLLGIQFTYKFGVSFLFYVCYFLMFSLGNDGNTIGKLIFEIKVVSEDEFKISTRVRVKRTLLKIVTIIILPVAVLLFLFKDYFTIHDHYSGTKTVRKS